MHCNLRPPDVAPVVLCCFWPDFYCTCSNCHFQASDQNVDIAIRFSDASFLKVSNIWLSDDVITLWPWPLITWPWTSVCIVCHVRDQRLYQIWAKSNNTRLSYWWVSTFLPSFRLALSLEPHVGFQCKCILSRSPCTHHTPIFLVSLSI